ncbi:hypothetical protein GGF46_003324 [Coemansia sp. RSA 552]|nr:hypothetical protein GGF46_003324 [Coemansia sp. RSA 552]
MGSSNSKSEPVYVYGSEVPIGLKDKIAREAASSQPAQQPAAAAAPGSSGPAQVSSHDLADEVEKEVAKELARILEKSQNEQLKARERQASTAELLSEIRDASQQMGAGRAAGLAALGQAAQARDRVAGCLRQHEGRALDCWKEVDEFRGLVAELEREFVAGSRS